MAIQSVARSLLEQVSLPIFLPAAFFVGLTTYVIYRCYLDELAHIPGPLLCRLTVLWVWYHSYIGDESSQIDYLHKIYGPIVRVGPQDVVLSDGEALAPIYTDRGGFLKSPCYSNFDFEGHATIFSALDPKHRSVRSKAVLPMFSLASIREKTDVFERCVDKFMTRLQQECQACRSAPPRDGKRSTVNVLNLSRGLAIDTICSFLFGEDYGGVEEKSERLSASGYVDSVVSFGNTFFLPKWLFDIVMNWSLWLQPSEANEASEQKVKNFTVGLVEKTSKDEPTYQGRLLKAGITEHETDVQMRDVIFAGTDSTGTNLATVMWLLAKHPGIYDKLQDEVVMAEDENPGYDPQQLPYLQGVVREGLRLSLANPVRFPRQVPPAGWTYTSSDGKTYHVPGGTRVGISAQTLHHNPEVFPDPFAFAPERWTDNATSKMYRDWIPFNVGARQCIARNLAMAELTLAVRALAKSGILRDARPIEDKIQIVEWFNSKIVGETVELNWS